MNTRILLCGRGFILAVFILAITVAPAIGQTSRQTQTSEKQSKRNRKKDKTPTFDGEAAYEYLKAICEIGPRISGTQGMIVQQKFIEDKLKAQGAEVSIQKFKVKHPETGKPTELGNLIARWHPERKKRLLICCHYDTRPYPDQDKKNPRGVFLGANDGASGVGLLCELAKHMKDLDGPFGIDFVFFDGEEFVYVYRRDPMFLGSTHFAEQYVANPPDVKYSYGLLVDMIGDKSLQLYYEENSLGYADGLTRSVWGVAQRLGVREFVAKKRHKLRDDHLPLNAIAKIQTCDIIDFDYPNIRSKNAYWHTTRDIPENCSADSLTKVGWVVLEWLKEMETIN